jgi:hypothetical protein
MDDAKAFSGKTDYGKKGKHIYNAIPEGILIYVAKCCHVYYKKT